MVATQTFFWIFTPTWGNDPIWLIFFRWVETTNQIFNPGPFSAMLVYQRVCVCVFCWWKFEIWRFVSPVDTVGSWKLELFHWVFFLTSHGVKLGPRLTERRGVLWGFIKYLLSRDCRNSNGNYKKWKDHVKKSAFWTSWKSAQNYFVFTRRERVLLETVPVTFAMRSYRSYDQKLCYWSWSLDPSRLV